MRRRRHRSDALAYTVATTDGALLRVHDHPATDEGADLPTLVLAHGWTLTHESWSPVIDRVRSACGARVVTWDQRGHGGSRPGSSAPDVHALGDDLAEVLAVAAPAGPVVLAGHSMGGMTVMAYAGTHPDEVRDRVRGVALVATSAGELHRGTAVARRNDLAMRLLSRAPALRPGRLVTAASQRRLLFGETADPDHVRLTRDQVASTRFPVLGGWYGALMKHDEATAVAALADVPTRVLVGSRDRLTPKLHSERLVELVAGAQLEVVPGGGHMLTYEATDVVAQTLLDLLGAGTSDEDEQPA